MAADMPPPSSQSHFEKFDSFVPDAKASFDNEFARLASSQNWVSGSQEYSTQRTIALRSEFELHYFPQSQVIKEEDDPEAPRELTEKEKLEGFQALCLEVRIPARDSINECKKDLKNTYVNIVSLIDARRTGAPVKVWEDFEAFRQYTLIKENMIRKGEAGEFLGALLQRVRFPRGSHRRDRKKRGRAFGVQSGRIVKREARTELMRSDIASK